jgi:hypothetical protein
VESLRREEEGNGNGLRDAHCGGSEARRKRRATARFHATATRSPEPAGGLGKTAKVRERSRGIYVNLTKLGESECAEKLRLEEERARSERTGLGGDGEDFD